MQDLAIGKRIKDARAVRGMSQQALASAADLATRTVARIESGEDCTVSTLAKIAGVFGMDVVELLGQATDAPARTVEAVS